jgi:hypothetical protein
MPSKDVRGLVIFQPEQEAIRAIREKVGARSDSAVVRKAIRLLARYYKIPVAQRRYPAPKAKTPEAPE